MNKIKILPDATGREAMKKLNKTGEKCLVVVDDNDTLLGTLSDGDLRKAILNGIHMSDSIKSIYSENPSVLIENNFNDEDVKKLFINKKFDLIPIVSEKKKLIDVLFWDKVFNGDDHFEKNINVPVVIMAGGEGTRLAPFTNVLPKPLIPVHDKPIIEHIIQRFYEIGCQEFYITVNYKSGILKAYINEIERDYTVEFVDESIPLGTAGSLNLLKERFDKPFFVSNCDNIIKTNYASLYEFHNKGGYDLTLVASSKEVIIPYGACKLNSQGDLSHINEKPKFDFLINTGLYLLNPDVLNFIPNQKLYHQN